MHSHQEAAPDFPTVLEVARDRLIRAGDTALGPVSEKLSILDQMAGFELGRFLLQNNGFDCRWSHYCFFEYPKLAASGAKFHAFEKQFLEMQVMRSSQERYELVRKALLSDLKPGMSVLSVPCGIMAELLTLPATTLNNVQLTGVDLDPGAIELSKVYAAKNAPMASVTYLEKNAWQLDMDNRFDRLVSIGLVMYCKNRDEAKDLYSSFYRTLKKSGKAFIQFLTPPESNPESERNRDCITTEEIRLTAIIYREIIQSRTTSHFVSSKQMIEDLTSVGFKNPICHFSEYRQSNVIEVQK